MSTSREPAPAGEIFPLEPFRSFGHSGEWQVSGAYWQARGQRAFYTGEVPYISVNDGRLATDLARWLIDSSAGPWLADGPIRILELGGGAGLFASLFLRVLKDRSPELYHRIEYVFTDGSEAMVRAARQSSLLEPHHERMTFRRLDAVQMKPAPPQARKGFDLILANYLLDVLPMECLYWDGQRWFLLEARAGLRVEDLPETGLSRAGIRALYAAGKTQDAALSKIAPYLVHECRYRRVRLSALPFGALVSPAGARPRQPGWRVFSQGALTCLNTCMDWLTSDGVISLQDYSCSDNDEPFEHCPVQRYAGSLSTGVNLAQVKRLAAQRAGWSLIAPPEDSVQLLSRLLCREDHPGIPAFLARFDGPVRDAPSNGMESARRATLTGRWEDARYEYTRILKRYPDDWHALERFAAFHVYQLKRYPEALKLLDQALALHDQHPSIWNTRGDAFKEMQQWEEAENAFAKAIELNPADPRAHYNQALLLQSTGRFLEALEALSRALAHDTDRSYHPDMIQTQMELLDRVRAERQTAERRELNRYLGFRDVPGVGS